MPLQGKFAGPGIYISDLDETHSHQEIKELNIEQFKMLCSFMDEKELDKLVRHLDHTNQEFKLSHVLNILSQLKY